MQPPPSLHRMHALHFATIPRSAQRATPPALHCSPRLLASDPSAPLARPLARARAPNQLCPLQTLLSAPLCNRATIRAASPSLHMSSLYASPPPREAQRRSSLSAPSPATYSAPAPSPENPGIPAPLPPPLAHENPEVRSGWVGGGAASSPVSSLCPQPRLQLQKG